MSYDKQINDEDGTVTITNETGDIVYQGDNINPKIIENVLEDSNFSSKQKQAIKFLLGW